MYVRFLRLIVNLRNIFSTAVMLFKKCLDRIYDWLGTKNVIAVITIMLRLGVLWKTKMLSSCVTEIVFSLKQTFIFINADFLKLPQISSIYK